MTKKEQIAAAKRRIAIGLNSAHPDWYEGIGDDAQDELHRALSREEASTTKKQSRKDALRDRAWRYGRLRYCTASSAHGFSDGYRAAMRDARKAWASGDGCLLNDDALIDFLRPLR